MIFNVIRRAEDVSRSNIDNFLMVATQYRTPILLSSTYVLVGW